MATTFHGFSRLPFELRHAVWEYLLPSAESELIQHFIMCLANVILALPHDTIFVYGVYIYYDGTLIKDFMQDYPPPYADLRACSESRVVALKHVWGLLCTHPQLRPWLIYPELHHAGSKLQLFRDGALVYNCQWIKEGCDLTPYVFWDFDKEDESEETDIYVTVSEQSVSSKEEYESTLLKQQQNEEKDEEETRNPNEDDRELWEDDRSIAASIVEEGYTPWDDDTEDGFLPWDDDIAEEFLPWDDEIAAKEECLEWDDETRDNYIPRSQTITQLQRRLQGLAVALYEKSKRSREEDHDDTEQERSYKRRKFYGF